MGVRGKIALAVATVLATFLVAAVSLARPGDVDMHFGASGALGFGLVSAGQWPSGLDDFAGMAVAHNGKILLAGDTNSPNDITLARLLKNGKGDPSFGDPVGHVFTGDISGNDDTKGLAVDTDGSTIVIAQSQDGGQDVFGVVRVDQTGNFDAGFGGGTGTVTTAIGSDDADPNAVAIQPNGKFVVVGQAGPPMAEDFAVVRYLPDGDPDPSFGGGDGIVTTNFGGAASTALGVAVQRNGRIVAIGAAAKNSGDEQEAIARYLPNGKVDQSFGKSGKLRFGKGSFSAAFAVAVQPRGRIVVTGVGALDELPHPVVTGLTPRGKLDKSFGPRGTGQVTVDLRIGFALPTSMALQRNGKILIAGFGSDFPAGNGASFVARLTPNGRTDRSFGDRGSQLFLVGGSGGNIPNQTVGLQPDGRIIGAGSLEDSGDIEFLLIRRFFGDPPQTRLGRARLRGSRARFTFRAVPAPGAEFHCALKRAGSGRPHFSKCSSPRRFSGLRPGSYIFEVRARSVNGPDRTPAKRSFEVP